jgi:hypothetical protein
VCAEGLDDDVPQTSISVDRGLVRLLAGFGEFVAGDVELDLVGKLLACQGLQACNAVP